MYAHINIADFCLLWLHWELYISEAVVVIELNYNCSNLKIKKNISFLFIVYSLFPHFTQCNINSLSNTCYKFINLKLKSIYLSTGLYYILYSLCQKSLNSDWDSPCFQRSEGDLWNFIHLTWETYLRIK